VFAAECAGGGEVDDIETGIGRRFEEEHLRVGPDGGFPGSGVVGTYVSIFDAVFGQELSDHAMCAAEDGVADEEMVAFFEEGEEGGEDGAHAGGRGEAGFGSFEGGEAVCEFLNGGVAEAAIDITFLFVGEYSPHLLRIVVAEAAGEVYGGGVFPGVGGFRADTDGFGDAMTHAGCLVE
jgi:hypothetical protein